MSSVSKGYIEPVFFKLKDISPDINEDSENAISGYEICKAIGKIIGDTNVDGVQQVRSLFRVYVKTKEARARLLLREALPVMGKVVPLYDTNPFLAGQNSPDDVREKIIIRDLPLSVSNEEILKLLNEKKVGYFGGIKYGKFRNRSNELTDFRNGDRFIYAKGPVVPVLPRHEIINGMKVRIFHDGQFKPHCAICKTPDHQLGDQNCPVNNQGLEIIPFRSQNSVYSNFYKCDIELYGVQFDSSEKAYQWKKAKCAGLDETADRILNAAHAGKAKEISKEMPKDSSAEAQRDSVIIMEEVLQAKISQVPEFHDALISSEGCYLAEATNDTFWASGLKPDHTKLSHPSTWPGQNILGRILMDLRSELLHDEHYVDDIESSPGVNDELPVENRNTMKVDEQAFSIEEEHPCTFNTTLENNASSPVVNETTETQKMASPPPRTTAAKNVTITPRSRPKHTLNNLRDYFDSMPKSPKRKPSSSPVNEKHVKQNKIEGQTKIS